MTIDVHGHITSPKLFERFPMPPSLGDIDGMIERKAALGITMTLVGSPVGAGTMVRVPGLDNYKQDMDELDDFHAWIAERVREHPDHLRAYVYTNPYGGNAELEAAARWLEEDEFVGLIVNTSIKGEFLDSARADEFFAMAAERDAPVLLHPPAEPAGSGLVRDSRLVEHVARPTDITLGLAALVFSGWLEKYPRVRVIAPTAGAGLPLLLEKMELAYRMPARPGPAPSTGEAQEPTLNRSPNESLPQIYVDTSSPSTAALNAAVRAFGPRRMLFGTDSPPLSEPLERALGALDALALSSESDAWVRHENARDLFALGDESTASSAPTQRDRIGTGS